MTIIVSIALDSVAYEPGARVTGIVRVQQSPVTEHHDALEVWACLSGFVETSITRSDDGTCRCLRACILDRLPVFDGPLSASGDLQVTFDLPDTLLYQSGKVQADDGEVRLQARVYYRLAINVFEGSSPRTFDSELSGELVEQDSGSCGFDSAMLDIVDLGHHPILTRIAAGLDSVSIQFDDDGGGCCSPPQGGPLDLHLRCAGAILTPGRQSAVRLDALIDNTTAPGNHPVSGCLRVLRRVMVTDPGGPPVIVEQTLWSVRWGPVPPGRQLSIGHDVPIRPEHLVLFRYAGEKGPRPVQVKEFSLSSSSSSSLQDSSWTELYPGVFTVNTEYYAECGVDGQETAARLVLSDEKRSDGFL